jgi:hypothetical protein
MAAAMAKSKAKKKAAETQAKRPPMPTGWRAASIERKIEKLRKKERWSFRAKHGRTDFYRYLEAVYGVQDWDDEKASERWSQSVAALFKVRTRLGRIRIAFGSLSTLPPTRIARSRAIGREL